MSIAEIKGYKEAYYQMVRDVNGPYKEQYEDFNSENVKNFNKLIEKVIVNIGPENIDEELHYSRNNLNIAFPTLPELIAYNESVADDKKWKEIPYYKALYHLNGENGIFNVKYVSPDEHFEAIYNRNGVLLTENNDAVNMSTYNFFGPNKGAEHKAYDVDPYFKYGNTEETNPDKSSKVSTGSITYNVQAAGNGVNMLYYNDMVRVKLGIVSG